MQLQINFINLKIYILFWENYTNVDILGYLGLKPITFSSVYLVSSNIC